MKHQKSTWECLVARLPAAPEELLPEPPYGFSTRVVARWRAACRDESLRRWTRWSFRTALASAAACAWLALFPVQDPCIVVPLPELPTVTHLPTPP